MTTITIKSIEIIQKLIADLTVLQENNKAFWESPENLNDYNRYFDIKNHMQFSDEQMKDNYPDIYQKYKVVENHTHQFHADREKLKQAVHDAKTGALTEIGSHFGQQAVIAIKNGKNFYDAVHEAYTQSQDFRESHLDKKRISFFASAQFKSSHLLKGFSKSMGLKEKDFLGIMNTKAFSKIVLDENTEMQPILTALELAYIHYKQVDSYDDETEQKIPLIYVRFEQIKRADFLAIVQNMNLSFTELADENPFAKKAKEMSAPLEILHPEELKGLKSSLCWDLREDRFHTRSYVINKKIEEIDDILNDNDQRLS